MNIPPNGYIVRLTFYTQMDKFTKMPLLEFFYISPFSKEKKKQSRLSSHKQRSKMSFNITTIINTLLFPLSTQLGFINPFNFLLSFHFRTNFTNFLSHLYMHSPFLVLDFDLTHQELEDWRTSELILREQGPVMAQRRLDSLIMFHFFFPLTF